VLTTLVEARERLATAEYFLVMLEFKSGGDAPAQVA